MRRLSNWSQVADITENIRGLNNHASSLVVDHRRQIFAGVNVDRRLHQFVTEKFKIGARHRAIMRMQAPRQ